MRWLRKGDSGLSLPLFALAHAVLLLGVFRTVYSITDTGIDLYYGYAGNILRGQLPYRDFLAEYPPLALAFFTLPRLLGESYHAYHGWFQAQILAFDLVAVAALWLGARWSALSPTRVLAVYTVALLAVGPITIQQYDVIPATLTILAIVAYAQQQDVATGVCLALGTMTKIYPVLLVPLFAIDAWRKKSPRRIAIAAAAFTATCAVSALPWLLKAPASLEVLVGYHGQRGIQIESTWAAISLVARMMHLTYVEVNHTFGSFNITGPLTDFFARVSTIALLIALVASYAWFYRRASVRRVDADDVPLLGTGALILLLASLATSKVFSPQYLLWVAPLVPLAVSHRPPIVALFVVIGALTVFVFPFHYPQLLLRDTAPIVALALRDALVVVLAFVVAFAYPMRPHTAPPE